MCKSFYRNKRNGQVSTEIVLLSDLKQTRMIRKKTDYSPTIV